MRMHFSSSFLSGAINTEGPASSNFAAKQQMTQMAIRWCQNTGSLLMIFRYNYLLAMPKSWKILGSGEACITDPLAWSLHCMQFCTFWQVFWHDNDLHLIVPFPTQEYKLCKIILPLYVLAPHLGRATNSQSLMLWRMEFSTLTFTKPNWD